LAYRAKELTMHPRLIIAIIAFALAGSAVAQTGDNTPPARIGNRANGLSYQPTPGQVAPREQAAGIAPTAEQQKQTNNELFRMDAQSLKAEGLSTNSVPSPGNGR
jgi:hypothetical protein